MRLGVHIRTAVGLVKSLDRAEYLGCETVQLFSGNPNSWKAKPIDNAQIKSFRERCSELNIDPIILHTPYLLNLASPDDTIWQKSINSLSYAIEKAEVMQARFIVTHIGSHKGAGLSHGAKKVAEALKIALDCQCSSIIALELGAGAGQTIGSTFSEVATIMENMEDTSQVGVCIDSAHMFAAGYNLSSPDGVYEMYRELNTNVGKEKLCVLHLNDTVQELASHKDRHYHVGKGNVGIDGFRALINHPYSVGLPGIIETPGDDIQFDVDNLEVLRSLRA